jgi:3-hydroxyisobutyrate dehydrogenase
MAAEIQLPMPLVSAALQVYQSAIHARWTNDDDSTLWRLYLNGHGDDAIYRQTVPAPPISKSDKFDNQDIVDIFAGVHLAASIEAIRFVHALGLDADIMFDIISNAAGSNAQFVQSVPQMRRDAPSLRDVQGSQVTCERLVSG